MSLMSRRSIALKSMLLFAIGNGFTSQAFSQPLEFPVVSLAFDRTVELSLAPTDIAIQDKFAYVIGDADGVSQILQLDAATMEVGGTLDLPFTPEDLIVSFENARVYVVGTHGEESALVVLDDALRVLGQIALSRPVASPKLSLADGEILVIAGMKSSKVEGAAIAVNVADPTNPRQVKGLVPEDYLFFGATGVWLDNSGKPVVFLNAGVLPTLVAFSSGSKGVVEYGDVTFTSDVTLPQSLTIFAMTADWICSDSLEHVSFLIATPQSDTLFFVSFDSDFRSLDIVTSTPTIPAPHTDGDPEVYADSNLLIPTSLLASSCDLGVIWVGNRNSSLIEQFTLNAELRIFEKVGQITLSETPDELAISKTGEVAFTISTQGKTISRFRPGDGKILGTESTRTLQRLLTERGYSVGPIDGQLGPQTLGAAARFGSNNDVNLNVYRDIEKAIKSIEALPLR